MLSQTVIHAIPVRTDAKISLRIHDRVTVGASSDGSPRIVNVTPSKDKPAVVQIVSYRFDDWNGDEDVFELCKMYLVELETIVENGRKCGYLFQQL